MPIDYLALAKEAVLAGTVLNAAHRNMNKVSPERMARFWDRAQSWLPGHINRNTTRLLSDPSAFAGPGDTVYGPLSPSKRGPLSARKPVTTPVAEANAFNMGTDLLERARQMRPEQLKGVAVSVDTNPNAIVRSRLNNMTNRVHSGPSPYVLSHELGHVMSGHNTPTMPNFPGGLEAFGRLPKEQQDIGMSAISLRREAEANRNGARLARDAGIPQYLQRMHKGPTYDTYVSQLLQKMLDNRSTHSLQDLGVQGKFKRVIPSMQPVAPKQTHAKIKPSKAPVAPSATPTNTAATPAETWGPGRPALARPRGGATGARPPIARQPIPRADVVVYSSTGNLSNTPQAARKL
jgi:hypothetical protein